MGRNGTGNKKTIPTDLQCSHRGNPGEGRRSPYFSLSSDPAHLPATPLSAGVVSVVVSRQNAISAQRRAVCCSTGEEMKLAANALGATYIHRAATLIHPSRQRSDVEDRRQASQLQAEKKASAAAAAAAAIESAVEWQANKIKRGCIALSADIMHTHAISRAGRL